MHKKIINYYFKALGIYIGSKENFLKEFKWNSVRIKYLFYVRIILAALQRRKSNVQNCR